MLRQVLKQCFWDVYDHLGRLILLNVPLFFLSAICAIYLAAALDFLASAMQGPLFILVLFGVYSLAASLLGTFWFSGFLHFGALSSREKDPPARSYFTGLRQCGLRVFTFLFAWNAIVGVLMLNVWFYFFSGAAPAAFRLAGYAIGGICIWLVLLLFGVLMHALPLHVRRKRRLGELFKLGLGLTFKYLPATYGTLLFIASLLVIFSALKFIGVLIFGFSVPAMLINSLHDVILDDIGRSEKHSGSINSSKPGSWKQIQAQESVEEEERLRKARYNRTVRDILRPWEME